MSVVINQLKGRISREAGFPVWQKSFHDHVIRDRQDHQRIWEYIDNNPLRWEDDCFYIDIQEDKA